MADLSINTNLAGKPAALDKTIKINEANSPAVNNVQNNAALLTSEAIKNSKVEADVLATGNNTEQAEPVITEEMIDNLGLETADDAKNKKEDEVQEQSLVELVEQRKEEKVKLEAEKKEKIEQSNSNIAKMHNQAEDVKNKKSNSKKLINKNFKVILYKENNIWKVKVTQTPELNAYENHMKKFKEEYREKYPEPEFSNDGSNIESEEHSNWKMQSKKDAKKERMKYLANCNDDTAEQLRRKANAYAQADALNSKLK